MTAQVRIGLGGRSAVTFALSLALLVALGGCSQKSELGEPSHERFGNAGALPDGFTPMIGLDPNNPDDYPDNWPRFIVCEADNMIMAYVGGGVFEMGEGPNYRRVYLDPYYIDIHEVTNSQFDRFRKDGGLATAMDRVWRRPWIESNAFHGYASESWPRLTPKQKRYPEVRDNFHFWAGQTPEDIDFYLDYWVPGLNNDDPVRAVAWWEAWLYSNWAGKTLPTEAQWELAARGTQGHREYPWGTETAKAEMLCNSLGPLDDAEYVAPVMQYAGGISPYGCYNMSGNVWEWCSNNYDPFIAELRHDWPWVGPQPYEPHKRPGGAMDVDSGVEFNPVGPLQGDERVLRGGSYTDPITLCKVTSRRGARPDVHQMNFGFRCVLPIPPITEAPAEPAPSERTTIEQREEVHESAPKEVVE